MGQKFSTVQTLLVTRFYIVHFVRRLYGYRVSNKSYVKLWEVIQGIEINFFKVPVYTCPNIQQGRSYFTTQVFFQKQHVIIKTDQDINIKFSKILYLIISQCIFHLIVSIILEVNFNNQLYRKQWFLHCQTWRRLIFCFW